MTKSSLFILSILLSVICFSQSADSFIQKAKNASTGNEKAIHYSKAAEIYLNEKEYALALKSFEKSKKITASGNDYTFQTDIAIKIAECQIKLNKDSKAIKTLELGKQKALIGQYQKGLVEIYKLLITAHNNINNTSKANEYKKIVEGFNNKESEIELSKEKENLEIEIQKINNSLNETDFENDNMKNELSETKLRLEKQKNELVEKSASLNKIKKIAIEQKMQFDIVNLQKENQELKLRQQKSELENEQENNIYLIIGLLILLIIIGLIFYNLHQKKKAHQIIIKQKKKLTSSINYAKRIQEASLPQSNDISSVIPSHFILYEPKDIVSGDFYWFHENPNKKNSYFLAAVDCTGHGVPGAFMSMIGINLLNEIISKDIQDVGEIMDELNTSIVKALKQEINQNRDGMDMSLVRIDLDDKLVHYAGARNPLVYIKNNEINTVKADRKGVGGFASTREKDRIKKNFTTHTIDANGVDGFYLFSDGFPDQIGGPDEQKITSRNFYKHLNSINQKDWPQQKIELQTIFKNWTTNYSQLDDILVIGFKVS